MAIAAFAPWAAATERPSFLFFFTDDQAPRTTSIEGNPVIRTPNIDRLARGGAFFSRAYTACGQCAPSRASILTGTFPHSHGVVTNGPKLREDAVTFSALLAKAGYTVGLVGKWHLDYDQSRNPGFGFDYFVTDGQPWKWRNGPVFIQGKPGTADAYLTDWHGNQAIDFLRKHHDRPFFLWVCFRAPHAPLDYPPDCGPDKPYKPSDVPLPVSRADDLSGKPPTQRNTSMAKGYAKMSEKELRSSLSKYYSMIGRIDENIGRVLDTVDQLGLADRTVVVFASDNGWTLGEHRMFSKGPAMYEELVRGPMIVRYPPITRAGMRVDRVVSLVDLAPTFLEMAGVPVPKAMQADSLVPLLRNPEAPEWRDCAILEYASQGGSEVPIRGIVGPRYKYVDYLEDSDEFYDLKDDPFEMKNRINDPAVADVMESMRTKLLAWRRATSDPTLSGPSIGPAPKAATKEAE